MDHTLYNIVHSQMKKLHAIMVAKTCKIQKTSTILSTFILLLLTTIPLCFLLLGHPFLKSSSSYFGYITNLLSNEECDIFSGEWIPNPEAPYYTNTTCWAIHEHQNCMKYGRLDSDFIKWKWKPDGCDLPVFDPVQFLKIVKGKSMAFVGDSVGRNHMQSLICLLSKVEYPIDVSYTTNEQFKRWKYPSYNFTVATFWTPYLVKAQVTDSNGPTQTGLFNLYLDEFNEEWTAQIEDFDYVIINAGHWFFRPSIYFENHKIVGCHYCLLQNVTNLGMSYGYRKAFKTAFSALNSLKNYKGITFLRTFAPSHFENGEWNKGGNCLRTKPFRGSETKLEGINMELYMAQIEEFRVAKREGEKRGLKYRLLDATKAMLLRADGHPSKYGHRPNENVTLYNDCVHWCLPGPIDTWNDFLLEMLKMELDYIDYGDKDKKLYSRERKMKFK